MIVCLIFLIVGGFLLIGAISNLLGKLALMKTAERTIGTVVALEERIDEEGSAYYAVFEMHTPLLNKVTYRSSTGHSSATVWPIGKTAPFIIESGKPETARFLNYWSVFGWSMILLVLAIDLLVIGGGYFLLRDYFSA
ncbi:hypothetical protein CLV59_107127 [Chitinophaga dinghuensis]|uniref:DUF3592 domain-containing protein n=1 Tax=Chitinophaga dinghuensis TaxID=1539050 RepID=A0A327VTI6_9BACT|nr:hypothetical protein [Chitinophaga dinghuensis]RAJ77360.1 hypothetical protein CLV59_107127 [Chitinophaga dinghuensis]